MHHELKEKLKKYLTQFTFQQLQKKMEENSFPFFGESEKECLDLVWEVMAEKKLKNA